MMTIRFEDTGCPPSVSGGYLLITRNGKEIATVSIPSPVFTGRIQEITNQNSDSIEDHDGNRYSVQVSSTPSGVDWEMTVTAAGDENQLKCEIAVEYQPNDY
ncbi:hypothetical protein VA7868_00904 [Vibrio aerogenes CECT 7868]|uniref:Uncharacterized protein n=1 Tax=Vibrio aerogenes CECT 7868 TaxID=1216006 RepID=A0A1M5WXB0_9VIBR|nr:hypothetical protein [Vibrio aerogenes]SHH92042.1 hypothetical protein VA7868_00904 [Vibrio aerogenes CECT 7868]